ncbi:MAG TPA: ELWxxDGT repeat protein [Candidatus Polarisedimenticolia bacterium]|nr:ELWxxDGT repeat protein [Candidatus Polarisedimenticolia bacterium]
MLSRTFARLILRSTLLVFAVPVLASSGPARLLKDVNPTPSFERGSFPYQYQRLGSITIFSAYTSGTGFEVWRTDGTEAGTSLVKDINPGPNSSNPGFSVELGGALFFPADDGVHGYELWRTDGTETGTRMVKEIRPGSTASPFQSPSDNSTWFPQAVGGILYFVADDGAHGLELWRSDGTEAGTFPLGSNSVAFDATYPLFSTSVGGIFFFSADDAVHGYELWKTDGTVAGTVMVKDISPGDGNSYPQAMVAFHGLLLFAAIDIEHGQELWRSNGTEAGTFLVKDITPFGNSFISNLAEANGMVFFTTSFSSQLYKTDGTAEGTVPVKAFSNVAGLQGFDHFLLFVADDGTTGNEPWVSDGTEAGTFLLKDINSGPGNSLPIVWRLTGSKFLISNDGTAPKLYASDGTPAGTVLLREAPPGFGGVFPLMGFAASDEAFFFVSIELHDDGTSYNQLWKSDATPAGTRPVASPSVGSAIGVAPNGLLFFQADDLVHGNELWKTDGTDAGTALLKDINPSLRTDSSYAGFLGAVSVPGVGPRMLLGAYDGVHGIGLWISDGTGPGTRLLKDIYPGISSSQPNSAIVHNGVLFFGANDGEHGYELWRSDGTEAGTVMVSDINPGADGSLAESGLFAELNGSVLFGADDGVHGRTLWKTDGTPGGTVQVADVNLQFSFFKSGGNFRYPNAIGSVLYFGGQDPEHGLELWKTDGTTAGTVLVKDINPGPRASGPQGFQEINGKLFMLAFDSSHGYEPWVSDGTEAGTHLLEDVFPGTGWSYVGLPQSVGGEIYFPARVSNFGKEELWKTDGTEAGTTLVKEIPGSNPIVNDSLTPLGGKLFFIAASAVDPTFTDLWSSDGTEDGTVIVKAGLRYSYGLQAVAGRLLFIAYDDDHGEELWRSDGTAAGTVLAQDIAAGPDWSFPDQITPFGDCIFFIADDPVAGFEPWVARTALLLDQPGRALSDLKGEVKALHLARGTETGLTAKLDAAAAALAANQTTSAILDLEDFIHHVDVLAPKKISDDSAAELQQFAQDIVSLLESGGAPTTAPVRSERQIGGADNR